MKACELKKDRHNAHQGTDQGLSIFISDDARVVDNPTLVLSQATDAAEQTGLLFPFPFSLGGRILVAPPD